MTDIIDIFLAMIDFINKFILAEKAIEVSSLRQNIAALKEASGNLEQIAEVVRQTPEDFLVYSGDDSLTLPVLSVGGCGIISVAAHLVGERMQEMIAAFYAGNIRGIII